MTVARDTQRQKVYNWERANIEPLDKTPAMTLDECRALVAKVCADYGINPPRISDGRRHRRAVAYGTSLIALPRWARRTWTVLHEVAHTIHDNRYHSEAGHGPEFLRIYFDLLVRYLKVPAREVRKTITDASLKMAQSTACAQPMSREEKQLRQAVKDTYAAYKAANKALEDYNRSK